MIKTHTYKENKMKLIKTASGKKMIKDPEWQSKLQSHMMSGFPCLDQ